MAQVVMGKLLPNLKITLGDEEKAAELEESNVLEEGEISDVDEQVEDKKEPTKNNVSVVRSWMPTLQGPKLYENKNGGFVTGLDLSSEVLLKKLEDRAERFGIEKKECPITQNEIDALYKSLGIDPEKVDTYKGKDIRLEALHIRGVEEMNTSDIFKYFGDYGAASVEWINDFSCNVVWLDKETTARALLGLSKPLEIKKKDFPSELPVLTDKTEEGKVVENEDTLKMSDSENSDDGDNRNARFKTTENAMEVDAPEVKENSNDGFTTTDPEVGIPIPPGQWRIGIPHPKAKAILLRFATKEDKKIPGAEKRSHYYQKYGNPNYGGMRGLISKSKKRKIQAARNRQIVETLADDTKPDVDLDDIEGDLTYRPLARPAPVKMPRMKMYADEEEEKSKISDFKHKSEPKAGNIYNRLGSKYTKEDLFNLGKKFSSDSEGEIDDNVTINCTVPSRYNIWTDIALNMAKEDKSRKRMASPDSDSSDSISAQLQPTQDLRTSLNNKSSRIQKRHESPEHGSSILSKDLRTSLNNKSAKSMSGIIKAESSEDDSSDSDSRYKRDLRTALNRSSSKSYKRSEHKKSDSDWKHRKDLRSSLRNRSGKRTNNTTDLGKSSRDVRSRLPKRYSRHESPKRLKSTVSSPRKDKGKWDLRSKIKSFKEDNSPTKHRSPLCKDD